MAYFPKNIFSLCFLLLICMGRSAQAQTITMYHTVQFDAGDLTSGTYLVRMEAGDFVQTRQVVLLK